MMTGIEETLEQYDQLIRSIANSAITSSAVSDRSDLMQVGRIAAMKAIQSYDSSYGASMRTHVRKAVRNAIYDEAARFIGPMTIADHVITSLAAEVGRLHEDGQDDAQIASSLSRNRVRFECSEEYVRALRFLYQKRHASELSESLVDGDEFVTEDAIMRLLAQLETTPLEHSIIYERWLGTATPEMIMERHSVSRRHFQRVQGQLKTRLYELLQ